MDGVNMDKSGTGGTENNSNYQPRWRESASFNPRSEMASQSTQYSIQSAMDASLVDKVNPEV